MKLIKYTKLNRQHELYYRLLPKHESVQHWAMIAEVAIIRDGGGIKMPNKSQIVGVLPRAVGGVCIYITPNSHCMQLNSDPFCETSTLKSPLSMIGTKGSGVAFGITLPMESL